MKAQTLNVAIERRTKKGKFARIILDVAKAQRAQCPCYGHLCAACQTSLELFRKLIPSGREPDRCDARNAQNCSKSGIKPRRRIINPVSSLRMKVVFAACNWVDGSLENPDEVLRKAVSDYRKMVHKDEISG